ATLARGRKAASSTMKRPVRPRSSARRARSPRISRLGSPSLAMTQGFCREGPARSRPRSPSNEVFLKGKGLPQNRCYHRHRKGGPVTEGGRREYAEIMRERYQQATKQERSALLDEYCRVTRCHRKAAIRRLGAAPVGRGRAPGRPARYGRDLLPVLERI